MTTSSSLSSSAPASDPGLVLVYGATGEQARPVATQLLEAGRRVRVLTRDATKAADLAALGAEVAEADLGDPAALAAAHEGVDAVYLLLPFFGGRDDYPSNAVSAIAAAGVKLVVWNPTGDIPEAETGNPGLDVRYRIRNLLDESGVPYVGVVPTAYLENFLQPAIIDELVERDTFAYAIPKGASMQWISHRDAAAYAVAAFTRPELANTIVRVSGPEGVGGEEIAAAFGRGLGRDVSFRRMSPAEFGRVIGASFGPEAGASIELTYEQIFENPAMASSSVDFAGGLEKLPIKPTTVEQWARQHAALFQPKPR